MKEPNPINIFEIRINIRILSISIQEFIIKYDYSPYIIMNKTTLDEMEQYCIDYFASIGIIKYDSIKPEEETIPKFQGCKVLVDNSLNDGEVLLR